MLQNAIEALKKSLNIWLGPFSKQETTLAKLTNVLASFGRVSASSLSSFLDQCRAQRERLLQFRQVSTSSERCGSTGFQFSFKIASELAINSELVEDAVWEGDLIILAVFHEILTSKADLEDVATLQGDSAQFVLDLIQDVRNDPPFRCGSCGSLTYRLFVLTKTLFISLGEVPRAYAGPEKTF